ncbi:ATP-binding protein [Streptomyces sp. CHD11]|uniref:ATP-binding protein n=1 Tax=Streptomyces sp. CHD11 TaxID=2741325 RepID=UPI001BFC0B84|nr:ATP-binding protein [Streptomyces sp. CHD11]MBT3155444.1 ATP-binding protein [Streptomyces sp. CHD11]
MTSAPPWRRGPVEAASDLCRERRPARPRPTDDQWSVCFEVCPPRTGDDIPDQDARRVGMARRLTEARLRFCGLEPLVDDARLIVSELVTNAIQHGTGTQVTFTMTFRDGFLRLAVHGETSGRPVVRQADDDAERGRGLFLVDRFAAAHGGTWGTSDDGTTTWCTLAVPDGRP